MEITLSGNTRYMVFQCAMIFDRLYDKARNLKNNYSDRLCLEGDDDDEDDNDDDDDDNDDDDDEETSDI